MLTVRDRFTIGFIAGVTGGVAMNIGCYISFASGINELLFLEWASMFMFGQRTGNIGEAIMAQVGQLLFSGFIGIIFAYLVVGTTSRYLYFKGVVYSLIVMFFSYAIIVLYRVTPLIPVRLNTVVSNIVTVALYGLVLAYVHKKIYFGAGGDIRETD